MNFIEHILEKCPNAKVMITCRVPSKIHLNFVVKQRSTTDSWLLFLKHCGQTISEKEKTLLAKEKPDEKLFPSAIE